MCVRSRPVSTRPGQVLREPVGFRLCGNVASPPWSRRDWTTVCAPTRTAVLGHVPFCALLPPPPRRCWGVSAVTPRTSPRQPPLPSALRDRIYLTVPDPAGTDPPLPRRRLAHGRTLGAAACLRLKAQRVGSEQRPHVTHGGQRGPEPARSCDQPRHWNRGARPTTCTVGPEAHRDQPPRFPAPTTHWPGLTHRWERSEAKSPGFQASSAESSCHLEHRGLAVTGQPSPSAKGGLPCCSRPSGSGGSGPWALRGVLCQGPRCCFTGAAGLRGRAPGAHAPVGVQPGRQTPALFCEKALAQPKG